MGAGVASVALVFTGIAAWSARRQTQLQQRIHEETSSPYVWVDVRPDPQQGQMFVLVLGNSGPTIARDVTVAIDPPIEGADGGRYTAEAQERLRHGIVSLPPGRVHSWNLGISFKVLEQRDRPTHVVRINGVGPFGPLPELRYELRIEDFRYGRATPPGTLNGISVGLKELVQAVEGVRKQTAILVENLGDSWASHEPVSPDAD
jgi:hypothetical protein